MRSMNPLLLWSSSRTSIPKFNCVSFEYFAWVPAFVGLFHEFYLLTILLQFLNSLISFYSNHISFLLLFPQCFMEIFSLYILGLLDLISPVSQIETLWFICSCVSFSYQFCFLFFFHLTVLLKNSKIFKAVEMYSNELSLRVHKKSLWNFAWKYWF